MRLLIISRKYPPSIGGMQEYTYQLIRHLARQETVYQIAREVPRLLLPAFVVWAFVKSWRWIRKHAIQVIHVHDGVLAPLGLALKLLTRTPAVLTIHGMDIVYSNRFYQWLIPRCVRRLDRVVCISQATKRECLRRGIPESRLRVIPFGVSEEFAQLQAQAGARQQVAQQYSLPTDKKILLSVGRLIERKGFHWFISEVMPRVLNTRQDVMYLLAGPGPMERTLRRLIQEKRLADYVKLLGGIRDRSVLALLYNAADLFLMPNIPVNRQIEGFGFVVIEAASCGLPVIASRLDGVQDAITDGKNGFLVEPLNANQFADTILSLLDRRAALASQVRRYTLQHYAWGQIVHQYRRQFLLVIERRRDPAVSNTSHTLAFILQYMEFVVKGEP